MFETESGQNLESLVEMLLTRPEALGQDGREKIRQAVRGPVTLQTVAFRLAGGLTREDWRVRERAAASFHELLEPLSLPQAQPIATNVVSDFLTRLSAEEEFGVYKVLVGTLTSFAQALQRKGNAALAGRILEAFQAQLSALRERSWEAEIVAALAGMPDPRALEILVGLILRNELFEVCADALVPLGARAVPTLLASLEQSEERTQRMRVVDVLVRIGDEAERATLDRLQDEQWFVRRNAAFVLAFVGKEGSVVPLAKAARDPEPRVRAEAVRALSRLGGPEAERTLVESLKDKDLTVAAAAAEALGKHGGEEAVKALAGLLAGHGPFGTMASHELRLAATRALGRTGDPQALAALVKGTFDSDPQVKAACQEALKMIKDKQKGSP